MNNNFSQMLQNPNAMVLKKFMFQILESKIANYEEVLTRIGFNLITEQDLKSFALMINDVMEIGYRKAVEDYRKQLNDMGIGVTIKD